MTDHNLVKIYKARDELHAHLLKSALEAEGIEVHIEGEMLLGAVGAVPTGWSTAPDILVAEQNAEQARLILEELEELEKPKS